MTNRADVASQALSHSFDMERAGQLFHNDAYFTAANHQRLGAKTLGENVAFNSSVVNIVDGGLRFDPTLADRSMFSGNLSLYDMSSATLTALGSVQGSVAAFDHSSFNMTGGQVGTSPVNPVGGIGINAQSSGSAGDLNVTATKIFSTSDGSTRALATPAAATLR